MSKVDVGDRYLIEIAEVIKGGETGLNQYRIKGFDKVFFDDKGLKFLTKYDTTEFFEGYDLGLDVTWALAHKIMEIPIKERAKLFNISHNKASFKDISEKFSVNDAMSVYNDYCKQNTKKNIKQELKDVARNNNYTLAEIGNIIKKLLEEGE